ncbi:hypothetical protein [Kitasatospora sp. NPDC047058]|uniref:hypothetical protein n=1 Tax=Kitasatospora sp. NPDC047058 TaxID=3155620 RepID=UPI0034065BF5
MTHTPVRIGPSRPKDALLALLLLPVLGALPLAAFWAAGAAAEAAGGSTDQILWAGGLSALVIGYGVPVAVVVRGWRAGYEYLAVAAGVAPFVLPVWGCAGLPGL